MQDAHAVEIVKALTDLTRHVANIDAQLKQLVSKDGLRVELGLHEKLDKLASGLAGRR